VAEARAVTYSLKADPQSAAYQLVRAEGSGPELPLVDHVVKLEFQYFGDPEPPRLVDEESVESPELHATYGAAPPPVGESRGAWPPGESCTFALVDGRHQPRLDVLGAGSGLVEITPALLTDGPWCADADTRNRFDADLLRIRRVRFTLRVQTALASLRGPVGALFARGGTARAGGRYVPDIEIQLDATPRNLSLAR
jgi:hypothetical protein